MAQATHTKVRGHASHRDATKDFLKLLAGVSRAEGWSEYDAFVKYLDAATRALLNPVLRLQRDDAAWDANEAAYMDIVRRCRHPSETMTAYAQCMAIMSTALQADPADFLSPIFMEVANNPSIGQFFTPWELSYMMAKMSLGDAQGILAANREMGHPWISIHEPACGVGGMVLAGSKVCKEAGLDLERDIHWTCIDVDWKAVCGTYVQASLCGISADVIHGNALSLEVHATLPTISAVMHPKFRRAAITGSRRDEPGFNPPPARVRSRPNLQVVTSEEQPARRPITVTIRPKVASGGA